MIELPTVSTAYLWFDTEYTSLDLEKARLLQVALVITDVHLNRIGSVDEDVNLYLQHPASETVSPFIMETMPDLVDHCRSSAAVSSDEADRRLAAAILRTVVVPLGDDKKKPILAGNSIHADWYLLLKFLPSTRKLLHYRHLDVTTLKLQWQDHVGGEKFEKDDVELVRRYFPGLVLNSSSKLHDAYYDCQASIAELAYYREKLFKSGIAEA